MTLTLPTRHLILFTLLFGIFVTTNGQCVLTIHQIGTPLPELVIANYDDTCLVKVNDSTLKFTCNPTEPDWLFIFVAFKTNPKWVTRIWADPNIKFRELTIDYTKKTCEIKNPNEIDLITKKTSDLDHQEKYVEELAIIIPYIEKHPDSFLSLWYFMHSHALYIENPKTKLDLFNKLSPSLSKYKDYNQVKASFGPSTK